MKNAKKVGICSNDGLRMAEGNGKRWRAYFSTTQSVILLLAAEITRIEPPNSLHVARTKTSSTKNLKGTWSTQRPLFCHQVGSYSMLHIGFEASRMARQNPRSTYFAV